MSQAFLQLDTKQILFVSRDRRLRDVALQYCGAEIVGQPAVALPHSPLAVRELTRQLTQQGHQVDYDDRLAEWLVRAESVRKRMRDFENTPPDDGLYRHQASFVQRVQEIPSQILADAVGSGKTVSALVAIRSSVNRALIVCPNVVKEHWAEHVERWTDLSPMVLGNGSRRDRERLLKTLPERCVLVVNWESLVPYREYLETGSWDAVITDEAHRAKNRQAKRTQALTGCGGKGGRKNYRGVHAPVKLALTGTPFEKSAADLWPVLHWFDPRRYSSYWRFAYQFADTYEDFYGWKVEGIRDERILADVLSPIMRALPLESLGDVPQLIIRPIALELSKEQMKAYRRLAREMRQEPVFRAISELRQATFLPDGLTPSVKLTAARELLEDVPSQAVIFDVFLRPLELVAQEVRGMLMIGVTPQKEREEILKAFQSSERGRLCMTIQLGGEALSLPTCNYALFVNLPWSYTQFTQACARVRRITSQSAHVVVDLLIAKGTIDEKIIGVLERKQELSRRALEELVRQHINEVV